MKELTFYYEAARDFEYDDKFARCLIANYLPTDPDAVLKYAHMLRIAARRMTSQGLTRLAESYHGLSVLVAENALASGANFAVHRGVDNDTMAFEPSLTPVLYSREGVSYLRKNLKGTVGFLHGHFRLFTPSSLAHIAFSASLVDSLLVGLESGSRAERYKGVPPILPDDSRLRIIRQMIDLPFLIGDETPYTDNGYLKLLRDIKTDVYFGQSGNSDKTQITMAKRAESAGCSLYILPEVPGFHTSEIIAQQRLLS